MKAGSCAVNAGTPLISVVIACFNAAATLGAAIASVIAQGRDDVELIVIDGNSTDNTVAVIRAHADRIDHWVSEPDSGIYDAWNKGVRAARGRYMAFVGADDVLLPGALDAYARLIAAVPDAEYLSARVQYGEGPRARVIGAPWRWDRFRRYMTVAHVGSMHRRSLYDRIGLYDDGFAITGDYELLLRAGPSLRTAYMTDVTARMGVDGISSGRSGRVFAEAARAKRRHAGLPEWVVAYDLWRAAVGQRIRQWIGR